MPGCVLHVIGEGLNSQLFFADVGIPMIIIQWPLMLCASVPVIVVEALLIRKWVQLSYKDAFIGLGKANLVSTLVGIPIAWLTMLAIEFAVLFPVSMAADKWHWKMESPIFQVIGFVLGMAWIGPSATNWIVLTAVALLLIPCFFASVWIERRICVHSWPAADKTKVRRGVYLSNSASYAMLFALTCGWIIFEFMNQKPSK